MKPTWANVEKVIEAKDALIDKANAEIDRLRGIAFDAEEDVRLLKNKNSRLCGALEKIANHKITDSSGGEVTEDSVHEMRKIARKALASGGK